MHIYSSRRNFFVFTKISYLQPFREIMGGQRIRTFSAKMTPQAKKMTFFRIFFFSCTSTHQGATFCFYQNFISSAVQRNQGGTRKKRYINDERTTNNDKRTNERTNERRTNERRTTNYMDDDNSPPGFFQNPRANNCSFLYNFTYNLLCRM